MTLPPPLRNHLADLIIQGFHAAAARRSLEALAATCAGAGAGGGEAPTPEGLREVFEQCRGAVGLEADWRQHAREMAERAERALRALDDRPLDPANAALRTALAEAAVLFDARLYFEVHELLEAHWIRASGTEREALQGLIQVAVGLHHLGNGNTAGARSLLADGVNKLGGKRLEGIALDPFVRPLQRCLADVKRLGAEATARFDWGRVPGFPRGQGVGASG